jgi:hypothetical protein
MLLASLLFVARFFSVADTDSGGLGAVDIHDVLSVPAAVIPDVNMLMVSLL